MGYHLGAHGSLFSMSGTMSGTVWHCTVGHGRCAPARQGLRSKLPIPTIRDWHGCRIRKNFSCNRLTRFKVRSPGRMSFILSLVK